MQTATMAATAAATRPRPRLRDFLARRHAARGPLISWVIFEPIGGALAYLFTAVPAITPSTVTLLGGGCGIAGTAVLATAESWRQVALAALLLLLAYALDCADGQLARATGRTSAQGAWLDVATDAVVTAFLTASLGYALTTDGGALSTDGGAAPWGFLLAGAYGASRMASLFTWTQVRGGKEGSLRLSALGSLVRAGYGAVVDTPFVYALLCLTRLSPVAFRVAILVVTALTLGRMLVAARRHFRALESGGAG